MFTLILQISKLTKAVVLNSFLHGRFWQFVYKENVRCTRLMQHSLQVVIRQMFVLCSLKIEAQTKRLSGLNLCRSPFILLWGNLIQTEPSIGASHQSLAHLAKQFQRRRLLEIGQSEARIVCGDHVCQRIGMKCAIFIEDLPYLLPTKFRFIWLSSLRREYFFLNRPIRNKNYLWRPCLLTDRDEISNLYRRPSIAASCQVSVHLAKNF
jgi:hypothetical protein